MSADETPDRTYTITEAADLAGVARSTIRRALDAGKFPRAAQDDDDPRGAWRIPAGDLEDAGYPLQTAPQDATQGAGAGATGTTQATPQEPATGAPGAATGTALVPYSELGPLFDRLAEAEREAGRAAGEAAALRERLEEIRDDARPSRALVVALVLAVLVALVLAVALAITASS